MKSRIVSFLTLSLLALPATAQEQPEVLAPRTLSLAQPVHASELEIRLVVTNDGAPVTTGSIFADLVDDGHRIVCSGSTTLAPTPTAQWIADAELRIWDPEVIKNSANQALTPTNTMTVKVKQPRKNPGKAGETESVEPVTIYSSTRVYKGPGTYELFSTANLKVVASVVFKETAVEVERGK